MRFYPSTISLIGLFLVFFLLASFFLLAPRLIAGLVKSCQTLFLSCRNTLFSFLSSPVFYLWLPLSLFLLAFLALLGRLTLSFLFLYRLKKIDKMPFKISRLIKSLPEIRGAEIVLIDSKEPLAFAVGLKKPRIYLSEALSHQLKAEELKAVFLHEVAHLKRKHHLKLFLANFFRDLLFFLPLAHQLYFSFALQKEIEADDEAVKKTGSPLDLARALLKTARSQQLLAYSFPHYHSFNSLAPRVKRLAGEKIGGSRGVFLKGLAVSLLILILLFTSLGFAFPQKHDCSSHCSTNACCQKNETLNLCLVALNRPD